MAGQGKGSGSPRGLGGLGTWIAAAVGALVLCIGSALVLLHVSRGGRDPARLIGEQGHSVQIDLPPARPYYAPIPKETPNSAEAPIPPRPVAPAVSPPTAAVQPPAPSPVAHPKVVEAPHRMPERREPVRREERRETGHGRDQRHVEPARGRGSDRQAGGSATSVPASDKSPQQQVPQTQPREEPAAPPSVAREPQPQNNAETPAPTSSGGVKAPKHRRDRKVEDRRIRDALGTVRPM